MLPDQDGAVRLFLAVKLARLRQAHGAQVVSPIAVRHLPGGDDVHQSPDVLPLGFLARPAHSELSCHPGSRAAAIRDPSIPNSLLNGSRLSLCSAGITVGVHSTTFGTRKK